MLLLMITRLVPLFPYNIQNFAYGITDVSFIQYSLYTFLFMLPGISLFTIASVGLVSENNKYVYFLIAAVILILVTGISLFLKRKYVNNKSIEGQ